MQDDQIEVTIKGVALDQKSRLPILMLQSKENGTVLPIWIGPFEASAIITELEGIHPPRPLTHDLFSLFIQKHHFKIDRVEIYSKIEDRYFCRLHYKRGFTRYQIDVRPSDGIALALRSDASIYCKKELILNDSADKFLLNNVDDLSSEVLFLKEDQLKQFLM